MDDMNNSLRDYLAKERGSCRILLVAMLISELIDESNSIT